MAQASFSRTIIEMTVDKRFEQGHLLSREGVRRWHLKALAIAGLDTEHERVNSCGSPLAPSGL